MYIIYIILYIQKNPLYQYQYQLLAMDVRNAKIAHKQKQIIAYEDRLMKLSDLTKKKTIRLAMDNEMDKSGRLALTRHRTHHLTTDMDSALRPPDQSNDIRTYSKMDSDIWAHADVRYWFNKNAPTDPNHGAYTLTPVDTGYVIRMK